ncbi:MAG: DUF3576 domain-containing protein [Alphaproteobacteria bacterium]|nr:DUF3576 domain-containing protein [Alphaproteobacteria bacterium]
MLRARVFFAAALVFALASALAGCGGGGGEPPKPSPHEPDPTDPNRATIFGPGGIGNLFGNKKDEDGGGGIGVNSFLWRASLDTLAFMPINSADAFGGVILTDWYSFPESPNERFKLNVYILGRAMRADGVRVASFRQTRDAGNVWRDAPVVKETAARIEDAILTRARQLRQETVSKPR